MLSKKDLILRLRQHPLYKAALASVDEQQAKRIAAIAENFLGQAADGLVPMIAQASDPTQLAEAQKVVNERGRVVSNTEPNKSGSKDD